MWLWIQVLPVLLLAETSSTVKGRSKSLKSPPSFRHTAAQYVAFKEGEKVRMPCVAKGKPQPEVRWYRDGAPVVTSAPEVLQRRKGTLVLRRPQALHAGVYHCEAYNAHGTAISGYTRLVKAELAPFDEHPVLVHNPRVGESLTLNCTPPHSLPHGTIYWVERPNPSYNAFTTINTSITDGRLIVDYEGNLHFANVQAVDARAGSIYACVLQNDVLQALVVGNGHIVQPIIPRGELPHRAPQLVYVSNKSQLVLQGDMARMKCVFSGYPTPSVHWRRLEATLDNKVSLGDGGAELVVPDVNQADSGRYRCTATDGSTGRRLAQELQLTVEARPYWITEPEHTEAAEEEDVIIDCEAAGIPSPHITWYINGRPVQAKKNPHMLVGQYQINFLDLDPAMTSVIQCNASNKHGYIYKNAMLNVLSEPPEFHTQPESTVEAVEGDVVELPCSGDGAPRPTIHWTKNSQPLNVTGSKKYHRMKKGNLRIMDVTHTDEGIYTCSLKNKYGEVKAEAILIVRSVVLQSLECAYNIPQLIPPREHILMPQAYVNPCQPPVVTEISFEGDGFIMFDEPVSHSPFYTNVEFMFKTEAKNGTLIYIADSSKRYYMMVAVKEGKLVYEYLLGKGLPAYIETPDSYNDGKWHTVNVRRFYQNGVLEVDNMIVLTGRSVGKGSLLRHDYVMVGGFVEIRSFKQGYEGCIKDLRFGTTHSKINFNINKEFFRVFAGCDGYRKNNW